MRRTMAGWCCGVKLDDTMQPPGALSSGHFFRTSYLPTYGAAVFLLILVSAGLRAVGLISAGSGTPQIIWVSPRYC